MSIFIPMWLIWFVGAVSGLIVIVIGGALAYIGWQVVKNPRGGGLL